MSTAVEAREPFFTPAILVTGAEFRKDSLDSEEQSRD
jgi:hypothetical protein